MLAAALAEPMSFPRSDSSSFTRGRTRGVDRCTQKVLQRNILQPPLFYTLKVQKLMKTSLKGNKYLNVLPFLGALSAS